MGVPLQRALRFAATATLIALLAACASSNRRAPVEERASVPQSVAAAPVPEAPKPPPPGVENAGKPGYYTVKPGDTMIRIGLDAGQNWRDIARWNGIDNPNIIEVGQVLRILPPGVDASVASARGIAPTKVEARPLGTPPAVGPAAAASATAPAASAPIGQIVAPLAVPQPEDEIAWSWPAGGPVLAPFDDARSKGLSIGGKPGDPVLAAADGRVVYAGSGLRGYGNLVIIKHNNTYLTAYAHNQVLLVKEDQAVKRGQKIAEMGSSDSDKVQLHFEIRRQGKPIDPARLLPPR